MLCFPNAKINLGLYITNKRSDGYHNIETLFYPIPLCDSLEFVKSAAATSELLIHGIEIPGNTQENLILKAYRLLKEKFPTIPSLEIHLLKKIPTGAGLGGGSADAAFFVNCVCRYFNLPFTLEEQENLVRQLGADCAFFIKNKPVFAYEKGDQFKVTHLNLKNYFLVLVKPANYVSTAEAYAGVVPQPAPFNLCNINELSVEKWQGVIHNQFEDTVFITHPEIKTIKEKLLQQGAVYASMSGSGASVYGLFKEPIHLESQFPDCFYWSGLL